MGAGALYTQRATLVTGRNRQVAISTTTATDLLTWTPQVSAEYLVAVYGVVQTAATDVTVTVQYTDPTTSAATTLTLADAVSEAVGPFSLQSFIGVQGGSPVTVAVTTGTANQVTATATAVALP